MLFTWFACTRKNIAFQKVKQPVQVSFHEDSVVTCVSHDSMTEWPRSASYPGRHMVENVEKDVLEYIDIGVLLIFYLCTSWDEFYIILWRMCRLSLFEKRLLSVNQCLIAVFISLFIDFLSGAWQQFAISFKCFVRSSCLCSSFAAMKIWQDFQSTLDPYHVHTVHFSSREWNKRSSFFVWLESF